MEERKQAYSERAGWGANPFSLISNDALMMMMMSNAICFYSYKVSTTSIPHTVKDSSIFSRNVTRRDLTTGGTSGSSLSSWAHFRRTCTCCDGFAVDTCHKDGSVVSQSICYTHITCQYDLIPPSFHCLTHSMPSLVTDILNCFSGCSTWLLVYIVNCSSCWSPPIKINPK